MSIKNLLASTGGGESAFSKHDQPGKSVYGKIVSADVVQSKHPRTKELEYWKDDNPKQKLVITVQTDQRDPNVEDDDGQRSIWIKWWGEQRKALIDAVRKANDDDIQVGGYFRATFSGVRPSDDPTMSDQKLFTYEYQKPGALAGVGGLNAGETVDTGTGEISSDPMASMGTTDAAQQALAAQRAAAPAQPAAQPAAQAPAQTQVDVPQVQQFIKLGIPDQKIAEVTGASLEAIAAIRQLG